MIKKAFVDLKLFIIIFILVILMFAIAFFVIFNNNSQIVNDLKKFVSNGTKIVYISTKKDYSNYPSKLLDKYEVDFKYISKEELSNLEKKKISKIINSNYFDNILIIYKEGKIVDAKRDFKSNLEIENFFQDNNIIPKEITDIDHIFPQVKEYLNYESAMIYVPYNDMVEMKNEMETLKRISDEYNITLEKIDAYLLSETQKEKLNNILNISSVDNKIVILIKDGKIYNTIRDIETYDDYLNKIFELKFIIEKKQYINELTYNNINTYFDSQNKQVLLLIKDDCSSCNMVVDTLNAIVATYNIHISYLNTTELTEKELDELNDLIKNYGNNDLNNYPQTLIIENKKIIATIAGSSEEKYFVDIFKENGIIK